MHKDSTQQIKDGDGRAFYFTDPNSLPGRVRRIVGRAHQPRLLLDVIDDFVLIKNVIAGGHHVDALREQMIGQRRGDRKAAGDVLGIHDREIDGVLLFQILQTVEHSRAARLAHDIANHQNLHGIVNR